MKYYQFQIKALQEHQALIEHPFVEISHLFMKELQSAFAIYI
jgi:hypothetical protein